MKHSHKTSYQLAKEAGVSPIMVSRFLSGKRDIRLATADRWRMCWIEIDAS